MLSRRRQRAADPHRPGHADGRSVPPLLDARRCSPRSCPSPTARPCASRLLGEELIAFRDTDGRVGLRRRRAARTAAPTSSSAATRSAACAASTTAGSSTSTGDCVDMPTDAAPTAGYRARVAHHRLSDARVGRIVWAYMGPPEHMPELPADGVRPAAAGASLRHQEAAGVQLGAGAARAASTPPLLLPARPLAREEAAARGSPAPGCSRARWPTIALDEERPGTRRFTVVEHDAGLLLGAARRADDDALYWRVTQFLMPNHGLAPGAAAARTITARPGCRSTTRAAGSTSTAGTPTAR